VSIDNFYWYPAGANDATPYPEGWARAKSLADLPEGKEAAAQVYFSHGREWAIDEQYFFEDADSARWFWRQGWEGRQIIDSRDGTLVGYQEMALWIGDRLVDQRGYGREGGGIDEFDVGLDWLPHGARRCDRRYHAMDAPEEHGGTVERARCTNAATTRVRVKENRPPHEIYEAALCDQCAEQGTQPPGDVEKEIFGDHGEHTITILGELRTAASDGRCGA
jgi:hypothetical protein